MSYKLIDPLAQSFFIDRPTVLTKVDLFFSAKDDTLPAYLNIRKNQSGEPGPYIVPLSETYIYPSSVNISANSNVATSVSFSNPIFLDTGEYSITLGSDSNNYRVWVSELGSNDVVSERKITSQPYIGALFKSQNASTWTPVESEDLKFKLYRANYSTSNTATILFTVDNGKYNYGISESDPLEVFPDSTTMRVYHKNHGMQAGSYVVLYGLSNALLLSNTINSFYGIPATSITNTPLIISNVTLNSYTVDLGVKANANVISSATRFGGPSVFATQNIEVDTIYPVISSVIQGTGVLRSGFKGTSTGYSVDSQYTDLIIGDNELTQTKIIAGDVTTRYNLSNTRSFTYKLELATGDSYTAPIIDTKQLGLVLVKNLVDSPTYTSSHLSFDIATVANTATANIAQVSSTVGLLSFAGANDQANARAITKGTYINITGSNPNNGQYRVIEVIENGANVRVAKLSGTILTDWSSNTYVVTNGTKYVAEEASTGSSTYSKYITRQVDFINDSTSLNFRLDVCCPPDSTVELYYKTKLVSETEILANKEFTQITGVTIPVSLSGEFYEIEKQLDNLSAFNAVIFKVVFKSTNSAKPPKIKNLRAIALA